MRANEQWWYWYGLMILMLIVYLPMLIKFTRSYWQYLEQLYQAKFEKSAESNDKEGGRGSGG